MREILFRGKAITGEWIYTHYNHNHYEALEETVGEFTGLLDKNGVKIFEGDIIQRSYKGGDGEILYENRIIEYKSAYIAGFQFIKGKPNNMKCKVIGNIHDNPELIKNTTTQEEVL